MARDLARVKTDTAHAQVSIKLVRKEIAWIKKYLEEEATEEERSSTTLIVVTTPPAMTSTRAPSAAPPSAMAPRRLSPSSSKIDVTGSDTQHTISDYETDGEQTLVQ
ncbi:hypothetical protein CJ030_MR7G009254 [Morella rubra]|uniref:Uncharacterized protein n=1 Tax=Morella rubra TaxID=262757 RepID=A0A6A1V050_9ROSI|nr:hypothetical protein CJ030_MR7G009254 [Morella rubra]